MAVTGEVNTNLSREDMQSKDVYFRRDIKTTNPRRLQRYLSNVLEGMGYTEKDTRLDVIKESVGEWGSVSGSLCYYKDKVDNSNKMKFYTGVAVAIFGFLLLFANSILGFILLIAGIVLAIIFQNKVINRTIWIKMEGEVYSGEHSESGGKGDSRKGSRTSKANAVLSEISIGFAGQTNEPDKKKLNTDIKEVSNKIDTLGEADK